MQTTESLKRKIKSADDLLSVVKTMKALAAVSIRQYQKAVESLLDYNRTVEMGLRIFLMRQRDKTLEKREAPCRTVGAFIFGSDQGLCGQLNDLVVTHALAEMEKLGVPAERRQILVMGLRAVDYLTASDQHATEVLTTPSSVQGITPVVQELVMILEKWSGQSQLDQFYLFYNKYLSGASYRPVTVRLLPVDRRWIDEVAAEKWPSKSLPIYTMDDDVLFSALIQEYLFVSLYRAMAESLASENASRLASMQNAEKNIEERLQELLGQFFRQRQMTITEELLDIVAGFEALQVGRR